MEKGFQKLARGRHQVRVIEWSVAPQPDLLFQIQFMKAGQSTFPPRLEVSAIPRACEEDKIPVAFLQNQSHGLVTRQFVVEIHRGVGFPFAIFKSGDDGDAPAPESGQERFAGVKLYSLENRDPREVSRSYFSHDFHQCFLRAVVGKKDGITEPTIGFPQEGAEVEQVIRKGLGIFRVKIANQFHHGRPARKVFADHDGKAVVFKSMPVQNTVALDLPIVRPLDVWKRKIPE